MVLAFSFLLSFSDGPFQDVPFAFEIEDAMLIFAGLCGGDYAQRVLPHIHIVEWGEFSSVSIPFDQQRLVEVVICRATESINGFCITPSRKQNTRTPPAFRNNHQLSAIERAMNLAKGAMYTRLQIDTTP
jgi:hypothetical protein